MSMKKETTFRLRKIYPFLKEIGCDWTSVQQVSIRGDPDLLICLNGRFVAMEIKDTDGVLSELQVYKLSCVLAFGGISMVVNPLNWGLAMDYLDDLKAEGEPLERHFGFVPLKISQVKPNYKRRKKV